MQFEALQRTMQTFNGNFDAMTANKIEKLCKENEFLKNEFRPHSKHAIKRQASLLIQRFPLKTDMSQFEPLDNSNS